MLHAFGGLAGILIDRNRALSAAQNANAADRELIQDRYRLVAGGSSRMADALELARTVAPTTTTVLLLGESGTGKEVMARAIHQQSRRAAQPFVAVNCVALTPELMESELFGHERGAFTGAVAQKKGRFELADGGTMFLDEIGELSPMLQAKLLRVLQDREFQRVGGTKNLRVDVRIIAATNRNLQQALQSGAFREDLYYRLNVVTITMPPLRERPEDIPPLARHFTERFCRDVKRAALTIDASAMAILQSYAWPGNVRELQNVMERAVVLCRGPVMTAADFPIEIRNLPPSPRESSARDAGDSLAMAEATANFKRALIRRAIEKSGGNQAVAARALGLQRSNLARLMKSLGLR
ncbi:MAG: sigma 54-interacting transcriptional regulator [Nitrospirota bacterium]